MKAHHRILDIQLSKFYNNKLKANGDPDDEGIVDVDAIDLEVNNNITFWNSGGTAATTGLGTAAASQVPAALPTAVGPGLAKASVLVPVIGQGIAVVATAVAIGQVFHNIDKAGQYKRLISKTKQVLEDEQFALQVDQQAFATEMQILNQELAYREAQLARTQTLNTIVICVIGVTGLVFIYGLARLRKK